MLFSLHQTLHHSSTQVLPHARAASSASCVRIVNEREAQNALHESDCAHQQHVSYVAVIIATG
jgi:hypothetical protein